MNETMRTLGLLAVVFAGACSSGIDAGRFGAASGALTAAVAEGAPLEGLYGISAGTLVYVDPETARATAIGPLGLPIGAVGADFACDGTLWGFSSVTGGMVLYTVDLSTGAGTVVEQFPGVSGGSGFEFGPDEETPYWRMNNWLYSLDVATGTTQAVASLDGSGVSLTMPATCDAFLSGACDEDGCGIARVDAATGASERLFASPSFTSLAAAPDGRIFAHEGGRLYRIDTVAGVVTLVGNITDGTRSYAPVGMAYGPAGVCCTPIDCSTATAATLWPPNHGFIEVDVEGITARTPVQVTVTGVRQDEPVNGRGDGSTGPDAELVDGVLRVRAERAGGGNGRVYQVGFTATAGASTCQGTVSVCVPHDRKPGVTCVDDGPLYDSTAP
jgi:hypothetical protein